MSQKARIIVLGLATAASALVGALTIGFVSNLQPYHIKSSSQQSIPFAAGLAIHLSILTIPIAAIAAVPIGVAWLKPKRWWISFFGYGLLIGYWFLLVHLANNAPWD